MSDNENSEEINPYPSHDFTKHITRPVESIGESVVDITKGVANTVSNTIMGGPDAVEKVWKDKESSTYFKIAKTIPALGVGAVTGAVEGVAETSLAVLNTPVKIIKGLFKGE